MQVSMTYLKDNDGVYFSPVTSAESIFMPSGSTLQDELYDKSTLVFVGESTNFTMPTQTSFQLYPINTMKFDRFDFYNYNDKTYDIHYEGYYTISIRFHLQRLSGASNSERNIYVGFGKTNTTADNATSGGWVYQKYDRGCYCWTSTVWLDYGDKIKFQYYCDGQNTYKIEEANISMIYNSGLYDRIDNVSEQGGVKYLRDKDNNIVSPIIGGGSVYSQGKSLPMLLDSSSIHLAAYFLGTSGTMTSSTYANRDTSISWTKVQSNVFNELASYLGSWNNTPYFKILKAGWYIIGETCRFRDYSTGEVDNIISIIVTPNVGTQYEKWVSAQRSSLRFGSGGQICLYLNVGDTVSGNIWSDGAMTTIGSWNFFLKYCGN